VTALCEPCGKAWSEWLDYRLPPVLSLTYGSGAARDSTVEGVKERQASRFEQWRSTIRLHQDLIARSCRAGHHAPAKAPRVIDLDVGDCLGAG